MLLLVVIDLERETSEIVKNAYSPLFMKRTIQGVLLQG
jgi:hypothetical protein